MLSFNVAAASALIPAVAKDFAINEFLAGRIVWFYMLPYGLAALIYGPLARSSDAKKILFFCTVVFASANFLAAAAPNIFILLTARVLAGISAAAIIPLSLILIAQTATPKERGKRVGGFFSFTFVSSLSGLFLSGILFWRWIFILPAAAAGLVSWAIYRYFPKFAPATRTLSFNYSTVLADRVVLRLFIYIFMISFIYHGIRQWLGVYFYRFYHLEQFLISMLLTMISLSGIFGESLGGFLADRIGRKKVINLGVMIMLAALFSLLFKNVLIGLFAVMITWGLGWTLNHAGVSTLLTDLPERHLFESASLNSSVRFLSGGLGAALGGIVAQVSFRLEFIIFIICLGLLLVLSKTLIVKGA